MATPPTYRRQAQKYHRRIQLCIYLTGGVGGLVVLGSGDVANGLFAELSGVFRAVLFTLLIITGGLLGLAFSGFGWAKTAIDRAVEDGRVLETDTFDSAAYPTPYGSDKLYRVASILVVISGAWLILCVWLGA